MPASRTMPAPPRPCHVLRRWLRFHLSTAVVMMFLAGATLYLNLAPQERDVWPGCLSDAGAWNVTAYGWPIISRVTFNDGCRSGPLIERWDGIAANVLTWAVVWAAVLMLCERRARRGRPSVESPSDTT